MDNTYTTWPSRRTGTAMPINGRPATAPTNRSDTAGWPVWKTR